MHRNRKPTLMVASSVHNFENELVRICGILRGFGYEVRNSHLGTIPVHPALREGIMNALVHRDYDSNGMITIEIHPDSLRVWNPGALPSELKPSDLKRTHPSIPRNPDIAHIRYLRGLIEEVGRGTQRILEACRGARLREPRWESAGTGTTRIFGAPSESTGRGTPEELSERRLRIVAMLESHGAMKAPQVEALLGEDVSDRTIRNDLGSLVSLGVLIRRGRGPNTTYAKGGDDAET